VTGGQVAVRGRSGTLGAPQTDRSRRLAHVRAGPTEQPITNSVSTSRHLAPEPLEIRKHETTHPLLALACCIGALAVTGCGSSSSSSVPTTATLASNASPVATSSTTKSLATTKFAIHAGLAFGAFHHWIYKPIKAGALRHPTTHKLALVKAGLASAFVYHELKIAADDAKSSKLLSPLVAPVTAAGTS
jgi:hypothetical protein